MQYLKTPNIPENQVKKVLVDYRISEDATKQLHLFGILPMKTTPVKSLYEAVCGHPDMQLHHLGGRDFCCAPEVYSYYNTVLSDARILIGESVLSGNYPRDIAYNVGRVGCYAFHNLKYTDPVIRAYYEENGVNLIHVNQGYSGCSICAITNNALITSDPGIAKKADSVGLDVLFVDCKTILLKGVSNGLFGGTCGMLSDSVLGMYGDVMTHPNRQEITDFCRKYNIEIHSLHNGTIEDIGSIIPLSE